MTRHCLLFSKHILSLAREQLASELRATERREATDELFGILAAARQSDPA
jgi:hypothetical protein